jgi:ferric-dicitrate binding protein FerR (iron transport regulator)
MKNILLHRHKSDSELLQENIRKEKIMHHVSGYRVPRGISPEAAWEALERKIDARQKMQKRHLVRHNPFIMRWAAAAAAIILITGLLFLFQSPEKLTRVAAKAHRSTVTLPDGSLAELNAGTEIVYNTRAFRQKRSLQLTGEAFFTVRKGKAFTVNTTQGSVLVLGTRFNVYDRQNNFRVQCYTGKVQVKAAKSPGSLVLTGGMETRLSGVSLASPSAIDTCEVAPWRYGKIIFRDEPLANVLQEAERQFGKPIRYQGPSERRYTGSFTTRDLDTALKLICMPMQLSYRNNPDSVLITE